MGRLIDADAMLGQAEHICCEENYNFLKKWVDAQITAYDVEKVVAELEERSYQEAVDDMDAFGDVPSMVVSLKTATSVVRNGGTSKFSEELLNKVWDEILNDVKE